MNFPKCWTVPLKALGHEQNSNLCHYFTLYTMFKDLFSYIKIPLIWWNVLLEVLYHIYNWWYHYLFAEICYLFAERKILELVRVMSDAFLQFTRIIWHYWVHFWSQKFKSPTYWPMSPFYSLTLLEAYTVPISHFPSITHVHIPINAFSSRGGANIPDRKSVV